MASAIILTFPTGADCRAGDSSLRLVPHWDGNALWFAGLLVKEFARGAVDQKAILSAFQEEGWPPRIDDPMPGKPGKNSHRRLHNAINNLHRRMVYRVIKFRGDGTGEGISWEPCWNAFDTITGADRHHIDTTVSLERFTLSRE